MNCFIIFFFFLESFLDKYKKKDSRMNSKEKNFKIPQKIEPKKFSLEKKPSFKSLIFDKVQKSESQEGI